MHRPSFSKGQYRGREVRLLVERLGDEFEPLQLNSPRLLYEFMRELRRESAEHVYEVLLDAKYRVNGVYDVGKGGVDACTVDPREVFKAALMTNSPATIGTIRPKWPRMRRITRGSSMSAIRGIDAVMDAHQLDAIAAPTGGPAWTTDLVNGDHFGGGSSSAAAIAGYPNITVPAGEVFGLPVGLSFFGRAWSEPTLIRMAYAFEQATTARRPPRFLPTLAA